MSNNFKLTFPVASGFKSTVYYTDSPHIVAKVVNITNDDMRNEFLHEVSMASILSDLNIGVKLYGWRLMLEKQRGILYLEKMDHTVHDYREQYPLEYERHRFFIERRVQQFLDILFAHSLRHSDLHKDNVMIRRDPETNSPIALLLIDASGIQFVENPSALPQRLNETDWGNVIIKQPIQDRTF